MKKIVVLTGAGISAESGLKTFRDADGLWEGHDVMQVATPEGWNSDPALVLEFYNQRRRQLHEVQPNLAHISLSKLDDGYHTVIITQNVDNLHERAGSKNIIHLHGELTKVRSIRNEDIVLDWTEDLHLGDTGSDGHQLRPHIVWFGESVPMLDRAINEISTADIILIIGTSMQVYPAAGLIGYAPSDAEVHYIDPNPAINYELGRSKHLNVIAEKATVGVPPLVEELLSK